MQFEEGLGRHLPESLVSRCGRGAPLFAPSPTAGPAQRPLPRAGSRGGWGGRSRGSETPPGSGESWLTPFGAWGTTSSAELPVSLQRDARNRDTGTTTTAATKPGGWPGLDRPHLPGSARRTRTRRGPERGPPLRSSAFSGPPPPRSEARAACGSHSPPLSPSWAGLGRRLSRREPRAPPLVLPGPLRPLPLASARGAWPQGALLPRSLLHASRAQRRRRQPSLRRFLCSEDRGQDLQASKDGEEKSYRTVTRLITKA